MHCVDLFLFLRGSFEDMGIFARIYLSICYGSILPPPPIKTKLKYVKNAHIFKATTQKKDQHSASSYYFFYRFQNKMIILKFYSKTFYMLNFRIFFAW